VNAQRRTTTVRLSWLAVVACSALVAAAAPVFAKDASKPVQAEVLVIHGLTEGKGVDPALAELPALAKPPFDSFKQKKLLSRKQMALVKDTPADAELPNGRKLQLTLLGQTDDGRHRVRVSINRPGKKDYLPVMTVAAAAGDPFFIAGQRYKKGTLIIGVRVGKPPAK